ncbi:MAG: hypothetical protein AAGE43_18140 [Pseudomonadota bacterium]
MGAQYSETTSEALVQPDAGTEPVLRVESLGHSYGNVRVLEGLTLEAAPGEIVCLQRLEPREHPQ